MDDLMRQLRDSVTVSDSVPEGTFAVVSRSSSPDEPNRDRLHAALVRPSGEGHEIAGPVWLDLP